MRCFLASFDIRFDVANQQSYFLSVAKDFNWDHWIEGEEGMLYRLPGTTLYGFFSDLEAAVYALEQARVTAENVLGQEIRIDKRIIVEASDCGFNSNVCK